MTATRTATAATATRALAALAEGAHYDAVRIVSKNIIIHEGTCTPGRRNTTR